MGWSLADVEGVEAVSGLGVDPESANSINVGSRINRRSANGAPGNSLTVNQTVADVLGLVVIASAGVSSLILVDHIVDQLFSVRVDSRSLLGSSYESVVRSGGRGKELKEEVGPVIVDLVDASEGGNQVLVGDPDEPAEPVLFSLDDHEEALSGGTIEVIQVLLDVLGIGLKVSLVEATGGVGEIDEGGDLFRPDSSAGEVVELEGFSGGGELGGLGLRDGHCQSGGDDGQD